MFSIHEPSWGSKMTALDPYLNAVDDPAPSVAGGMDSRSQPALLIVPMRSASVTHKFDSGKTVKKWKAILKSAFLMLFNRVGRNPGTNPGSLS